MIHNNIVELIGNTPLVQLNKIAKQANLQANIIAKVEFFNPGGSVKDRAALYMINDAIKNGILSEGGTIIEPTSGNTGIGLALISAVLGFKTILVMPDTMSVERQKLAAAYGAEIVLTPGNLGMKGAIEKAQALNQEITGSFIPQQFNNPANAQAHIETTAKEIWNDTEGNIDFFVAGVGSAGTISGIGQQLKAYNQNIKIIAVEPAASPILSGGTAGPHKIQGIGANFIPQNYKSEFVDEVITITNDDAMTTARQLAKTEGVLVGISSGAATAAAICLAQRPENKGKNIVVLLPDTGERYLSTELFTL